MPTYLRTVALLTLVVFLFVVGLSVSMGMTTHMDGMAADCPFMLDDGAGCPMTIAAHISGWQQLFTATPTAVSVVALIFALFAFFSTSLLRAISPPLLFTHIRRRSNSMLKVFSPILSAFSQGILHSRRYA